MRIYKTAILLSGNGSNFQALLDAAGSDPSFPADIALAISNRPKAYGLERAQKAGIDSVVINHREYDRREDFDAAVQQQLEDSKIEFICLAGFMRIFSTDFAKQWSGRMLNIHPSLLPSFKGHNAHEQVLQSTVSLSGCTVHEVVPDVDAGPIVGQAAVPRHAEDTLDDISARIRAAEHKLYPLAVKSYLREAESCPPLPPVSEGLFNLTSTTRIKDSYLYHR